MAVSYDKYIVMALTYVIALMVVCMAMTWKISLILWIFYVFFCLMFAMPSCTYVYMCPVVTC